MNVIHFSYMDNYGAGIAAVRYHNFMQSMGWNSKLYVKEKTNTDDSSIIKLVVPKPVVKTKFKVRMKNKIRSILRHVSHLGDKPKEMYCFYDFKGTMKSNDISSASKEKNKTSRYLKIRKIIADNIRNSKQD